MDFGLLKEGTGQTRNSIYGMGTPEYAPLEQYGRGGTDPRSDIYSLGATLYHLLTGHAPDDAITRAMQTPDPLRSPQDYKPDLSPQVAEAIMRALALRPEGRFPDVRQFRDALMEPQTARPQTATPPVPAPPTVIEQPTRRMEPPLPTRPARLPQARDAITAANVARVKFLQIHRGHQSRVHCVAFSPDGWTFASGEGDGAVRLWRTSDGKELDKMVPDDDTYPVIGLAFSPNGQLLAAVSADGVLYLWRTHDARLWNLLTGYSGEVKSVAFSPDGLLMASGESGNRIRLWLMSGATPLTMLHEHGGLLHRSVNSVAFSSDSRILASGNEDKMVRLWRVSDGTLLHTHIGHKDAVHCVAFAPTGWLLASGGADQTVQLWEVGDEIFHDVLLGHEGAVTSLAFAPGGDVLASGSVDGKVLLWSINYGGPADPPETKLIRTLEEGLGSITGVAFSPDGRLLTASSWDRTIGMWAV